MVMPHDNTVKDLAGTKQATRWIMGTSGILDHSWNWCISEI